MKHFLILLAMLLVFPMANAAKIGDYQCNPVNAVAYVTGYLEGPENCDGFDYCVLGSLTGTPNGEITYFSNWADEVLDPFGTGDNMVLGVGEERISTRHGDIYTLSHITYDLDTDVYTELLTVKAGTGKYENAIGRMVYHTKLPPSPGKPISFFGPISLFGVVCTP